MTHQLTVAFSAFIACSLVNPRAITMATAPSSGPELVVEGVVCGATKGAEKSEGYGSIQRITEISRGLLSFTDLGRPCVPAPSS